MLIITTSVCVTYELPWGGGESRKRGRGKEERWLHQGPEDEQGFVVRKKAFQATGTTQARAWRRETMWCLWGLDAWVKRWQDESEMRPDQMVRSFMLNAKELGSITEDTKVFRREWFHKRWHYETHFLTFFQAEKYFKFPLAAKIHMRKLIPGLLEVTPKVPLAMSPDKSSLRTGAICIYFSLDL